MTAAYIEYSDLWGAQESPGLSSALQSKPEIHAAPEYNPFDGLALEMGFITAMIANGEPVPMALTIKTIGTAIAIVYFATVVLDIIGIQDRLALAVVAVAAPMFLEVSSKHVSIAHHHHYHAEGAP